jgi:hypothetical protein
VEANLSCQSLSSMTKRKRSINSILISCKRSIFVPGWMWIENRMTDVFGVMMTLRQTRKLSSYIRPDGCWRLAKHLGFLEAERARSFCYHHCLGSRGTRNRPTKHNQECLIKGAAIPATVGLRKTTKRRQPNLPCGGGRRKDEIPGAFRLDESSAVFPCQCDGSVAPTWSEGKGYLTLLLCPSTPSPLAIHITNQLRSSA